MAFVTGKGDSVTSEVPGMAFVTGEGDSVTTAVPEVAFVTDCGDSVTNGVPEVVFVTGEGDSVTTAVLGAAACPRRRHLEWTHGARRDKCYFRVIVSPGFTSPLIIFSASGSSM